MIRLDKLKTMFEENPITEIRFERGNKQIFININQNKYDITVATDEVECCSSSFHFYNHPSLESGLSSLLTFFNNPRENVNIPDDLEVGEDGYKTMLLENGVELDITRRRGEVNLESGRRVGTGSYYIYLNREESFDISIYNSPTLEEGIIKLKREVERRYNITDFFIL